MLKPAIPVDENARLTSLHSLRILDSGPEDRFDRITRMAKRIFAVETCLISLVDSDRQWFKSKQGLEACETSREISFCGHAILNEHIFIVEDTLLDPRFADNPLVTEAPFIRFYAGCPIHTSTGYRIGTLCLIDKKPHALSASDQETLRDLAEMVENEIVYNAQISVDELTQVANRRGFHLVANHMLAMCQRNTINAELAFFDLNNFKDVNDDHGHAKGDEILQHFANLLLKCFRSADVVARLGGDEFAVMLMGADESSDIALTRLNKMAAEADCPVKGQLSWSVGTIKYDPDRHTCVDEILADCDTLMYANKLAQRQATR